MIVPVQNASEAAAIERLKVYGVSNLTELVAFLRGQHKIFPAVPSKGFVGSDISTDLDFSQVKGQVEAKRALEICAAGWHNALFIGPPGAGKTMLAERLPTIMPPMTFSESVDTTKIYSVAGRLNGRGLLRQRPFCSPHHTISKAGLVGGGCNPNPGQISLSQNGVLFLDELTEFGRDAIESLRQPLENGKVTISRANFSVEYPANFLLLAAANPCPCGFFGDASGRCRCSLPVAQKYLSKLSGPLLDRIDLHVRVKSVEYSDLTGNSDLDQEKSSSIAKRVKNAVEFARKRQGNVVNSRLNVDQIRKFCLLTSKAEDLMCRAFKKLGMSARSYHRVLRVSRTIADLEAKEVIEINHVREAIMFRILDKQGIG